MVIRNKKNLRIFCPLKTKSFQSKKGAIELSMSTIVILVLAMSMLILGLVLVRTIFSTGTNIMKMTDAQLRAQVSKIFAEDQMIAIYPDSRTLDIKGGGQDAIGIGIKNLIEGTADKGIFRYEVVVSDSGGTTGLSRRCGITPAQALSYIAVGQAEDNIPIAPGNLATARVTFNIPTGSPLCTIRYRVNVYSKGSRDAYATDNFDINIKAK